MSDEQIREWAVEIEDDRRLEHQLVWKALGALAIVAVFVVIRTMIVG